MRILVAGDYCPIGRAGEAIENDLFALVFGDIKGYVESADYSIVNLECPVVEQEAKPIDKCGPNLKCTSKAINALKWAGFDCVTLANNHFFDFGMTGVRDTLKACKYYGLDYVGGGVDIDEASQTLYKEINGQKLAVVNCCEHEFSIATADTGGSNPLGIAKQYYAIQEARNNADYVLVIIHGGVELFWLPCERMIETYRFFIDAGADAVVNHHQHCYSGYEVYKEKPIFYGLGNFCFDGIGGSKQWTSGYMVTLSLLGNTVDYELLPYRQYGNDEGVHLLKESEKESFNATIKEYNEIIADSHRIEEEYRKWCSQHEKMYDIALNPAYSRYTSFMFHGILGKRILSKQKLLKQYDYLINESHVERLRMALKKRM